MFLDAVSSCVINSELVPVLPPSVLHLSFPLCPSSPLPFITPLIKAAHPERTDFKVGWEREGNGWTQRPVFVAGKFQNHFKFRPIRRGFALRSVRNGFFWRAQICQMRLRLFSAICVALLGRSLEPAVHHLISQKPLSWNIKCHSVSYTSSGLPPSSGWKESDWPPPDPQNKDKKQ